MRSLLLACLLAAAAPAALPAQRASLTHFGLTGALPADAARLGYWRTLMVRCPLGESGKDDASFALETLAVALRDMSPSSVDENVVTARATQGMHRAERELAAGQAPCQGLPGQLDAAMDAVLAVQRR